MTNVKEQLIQELNQSPEFVVQEVLDFLLFIEVRLKHKLKEEQTSSLPQTPSLLLCLQFVEKISVPIPREECAKLPKDLSKNL